MLDEHLQGCAFWLVYVDADGITYHAYREQSDNS